MQKQQHKRKPKHPKAAPPLDTLRKAKLVTVGQLALIEPVFSEGCLRWHLFHREKNGLAASGAVVQFGRRLFLRPDRFRAWVGRNPDLRSWRS